MSTPAQIIQKKRDGKELSSAEIQEFIRGVVSGSVADYQASAFLMSVFFRGMTPAETAALTQSMLESGDRYNLSSIPGPKVDKHSTGGIGDKVSLILAPLAAACEIKVPMMSGRGLGFTGGTLDKLESIPGFSVELDRDQYFNALLKVGCAMIGQSQEIAPADKKLYALRDVTGTVECIPLIVASILSKKAAEGSEHLVFDIKTGSGAFMKKKEQARKLAKSLVQIGRKLGLGCRAVISSMDQPLGYAVGNSLEIWEAIDVLKHKNGHGNGNGHAHPLGAGLVSTDLKTLTVHLCAHMLVLGKVSRTLPEARKLALAKLQDGSAWKKFIEMVKEQGGNVESVLYPEKLPLSKRLESWNAKKQGFITEINAQAIGEIVVELGGGRKQAKDPIDPSVGLVFHRKLGAKVQAGDPIASVYAPEGMPLSALEEKFHVAVEIGRTRKPVPKLILEEIH